MIARSRLGHRAQALWIALTTSLWFIPSVIVGLSVLLALGLVELSAIVGGEALARFPRLFGAGAAGSRGMLSTIAGSVITVAGVTFSITIAALALASAQYTPRVLRTFMGDRANQVVLGTFMGVFSYCLVVLRTIRGGDEGAFVPSIAVLGGFVLAMLSVAVLIFFIHHIAEALQASTILDRVRRSTEEAIDNLFPDPEPVAWDDSAAAGGAPPFAAGRWRALASSRTGYVQSVDLEGLTAFAREHGLVLRMERAVGDFVTCGAPLVSIATETPAGRAAGRQPASPPEEVESCNSLFTISAHRTVEQDVAFGVLQMVDIALKALSPGINDTTTAVTCVDHLGAVLSRAAERRIGPPAHDAGRAGHVLVAGPAFDTLVDLAFDDIRRNAGGNVTVLGRLFDALEGISLFTANPDRRRVLVDQVALVAEACDRTVPSLSDRSGLATRARAARARLASPATESRPA